jgi:hypothetical protein
MGASLDERRLEGAHESGDDQNAREERLEGVWVACVKSLY